MNELNFKLERTVEQWKNCDPVAMQHMSPAAIYFALNDAKHDIFALLAEIEALKADNASMLESLRKECEARIAAEDVVAQQCGVVVPSDQREILFGNFGALEIAAQICRSSGNDSTYEGLNALAHALHILERQRGSEGMPNGWKFLPPKLTPEMRSAMAEGARRHMAQTGGNSPDAMYEAAFAVATTPATRTAADAVQGEPDYEALEREHMGDFDKRTGIYASPVTRADEPLTDAELFEVIKSVDPRAVRIPPGVRGIADALQSRFIRARIARATTDAEMRPNETLGEYGPRMESDASQQPNAELSDTDRIAIQECIDYLKPIHAQFQDVGSWPTETKHGRCIAVLRKLLATTKNNSRPSLDIESMLHACIPGGSICDPQVIADSIREYFAIIKSKEA